MAADGTHHGAWSPVPSRYGSGIETRTSLPAEPASAAKARRFVRDTLTAWAADEFEESATLLVSELVTNAVLHARSSAELTLRMLDGELWVGVSDGNAGPAVRKRYGADAATGRGLLLVERIATAWGTEPSGNGKLVWFQLAPGTGETAMLGAEADFAADLAELTGDLGEGGPSGSSGRGPQARRAGERPGDLRPRGRNTRMPRGPTGRRSFDSAPDRTQG